MQSFAVIVFAVLVANQTTLDINMIKSCKYKENNTLSRYFLAISDVQGCR